MKRICLCAVTVMLVVGLNGCKNGAKNEGPLPVLDFRADIPDREAALQDLGKVRYFRLQTPENVLLGDQMKLIPNKKGEMISHFNRKGQGGEEYARIRHILYDEKRQELFLDGITQMQVYGLDGTYKRSFSLPDSLQMDVIESLDEMQWSFWI